MSATSHKKTSDPQNGGLTPVVTAVTAAAPKLLLGFVAETVGPGQPVKIRLAGAGYFEEQPADIERANELMKCLVDEARRFGISLPERFCFNGGQVFYRNGRVEELRLAGSTITAGPDQAGRFTIQAWNGAESPRLTPDTEGFLTLDAADRGRTHLSLIVIPHPPRSGEIVVSVLWNLRDNSTFLPVQSEAGEEIIPLPRQRLRLGTGPASRKLQHWPDTWKHNSIKENLLRHSTRSTSYCVRLKTPTGSLGFQAELPLEFKDKPEYAVLAALQHVLPNWHALKVIDVCHALALDDPKKDGGFWFHPARFDHILGLRGQEQGGRQYAKHSGRLRLARYTTWLSERHIEIYERVHRGDGKGWRTAEAPLWSGPLLMRDPEGKREKQRVWLRGHPTRGRPAIAERMRVSPLTFTEASRWNIELQNEAERLFQLRDAAAYKLGRYLFIRARMDLTRSLVIRESPDRLETYAGVPWHEALRVLPLLTGVGIEAREEAGELVATIHPSAVQLPRRPRLTLPAPKRKIHQQQG